MLSYLMLGANDLPRSKNFYDAILLPMGYAARSWEQKIIYSIDGRHNGPSAVYVTKPYDGQLATAGNGTMTAFYVESNALVDELHAAGLAAGGTDEGAPGYRAEYTPTFYVAYLRDPIGNKLAVFCDGRKA